MSCRNRQATTVVRVRVWESVYGSIDSRPLIRAYKFHHWMASPVYNHDDVCRCGVFEGPTYIYLLKCFVYVTVSIE